DVELLEPPPVDADDAPRFDDEPGLGVVRAVEGDEAELGPRRDEHLLAELARLARDEPLRPALRFAHRPPGSRAARRPPAPRGRTRPCVAPQSRARAAPPALRAPPPSSDAAGGLCRRRARLQPARR